MAFPSSTPPLFLHLHDWAQETAAAMLALELRTVQQTGSPAALWADNNQTLTIGGNNAAD